MAPPRFRVAQPPAYGAAVPPMPVGSILPTLPGGCATRNLGGATYFNCAGSWLRPVMQGPNVVYQVIPPP